ncbi:hypothetical protein AAVH_18329 [Aphelenchoides avenae]|nr:hypothetical protein AAVH_18329 [Aphelenchus avenae]
MLPNESLLVVLRFADYKTLVLIKLAGALFLRLTIKFAEELARRRSFRVYFYHICITYEDVTVGGPGIIRYERANQTSLIAACRDSTE